METLGAQWLNNKPPPLGASGHTRPEESAPETGQRTIEVTVAGAHLSGMPLNDQLTERGARLRRTTTTAPRYRLYALAGTNPPKRGLRRDPNGEALDITHFGGWRGYIQSLQERT